MIHNQMIASSFCSVPCLSSGESGGALLLLPRKFLLRHKVDTKSDCRDVMLLGNT